jgi:hypothetical protein
MTATAEVRRLKGPDEVMLSYASRADEALSLTENVAADFITTTGIQVRKLGGHMQRIAVQTSDPWLEKRQWEGLQGCHIVPLHVPSTGSDALDFASVDRQTEPMTIHYSGIDEETRPSQAVIFGGVFPRRRPEFSAAFGEVVKLIGRASKLDVESARTLSAAATDALRFCALLPKDAPKLRINNSSDGEIVIECRLNSAGFLAEFVGDGSYGYAIFKEGKYYPGEYAGALTSGRLPADLAAVFHK